MSFDVNATLDAVREAMDDRVTELHERIRTEQDEAMEAALTYARHLADGGSPVNYPEIPSLSHFANSTLVSKASALRAVYALWNAERGSLNHVSPIQNAREWRLSEHLHEHLGEPVRLEVLRALGATRDYTPDEVMRATRSTMNEKVLAEKGKLDGKVAYRLRLRGEDEAMDEKHERIREDAFDVHTATKA